MAVALMGVLLLDVALGPRAGAAGDSKTVFGWPRAGTSIITLRKVKIVITEQACDAQHPCGENGPGVLRPNTMVTSIVAEIKNKRYSLDAKDMFNAWGGGRNEDTKTKNRRFGATCYNSNNCVIRAVIGDGIWTTAVQWEISGGIASRTVYTSNPDIIELFLTHIDPPGNVYY